MNLVRQPVCFAGSGSCNTSASEVLRERKALHPDTTVFSSRRRWKSTSRDRKAFSQAASRKTLGLNVVVNHASKLYPYSKL
ncbi:MAG: hypothetical protein IH991_25425 [Planctomycetes bacterium]|nr:hypothetical protein [Planctomycetota bacterium]